MRSPASFSTAFCGREVVLRKPIAERRQLQSARPAAPRPTAVGTPVGIDLGTTNSAISILRGGKVQVISDREGRQLTPSVVCYSQDGLLVGHDAIAQQDPANTFYSVKRLIGRSPAEIDANVAALRYNLQEGPHGTVHLLCPALGTDLATEEVSAVLLRHLLAHAEREIGSPVANAVVTVPAHFGEQRRAATLRAAKLAGLSGAHLLAEPVAAAVAYGLGKPEEAETILVVDLGGGTLDISILESFEGIIEVLDTDGDAQLGGNDFDRLIAEWALKQCQDADLDFRGSDTKTIIPAAEAAKIALSSTDETTLVVANADGGSPLQLRLTAAEFKQLSQPLLRRIWEPMQRAGKRTFLEWAASPFDEDEASSSSSSDRTASLGRFAPPPRRITKALLVGGGTRMPAIRQLVQTVTGIKPDSSLDPELCVAIGAGIQAAVLAGEVEGAIEMMDGSYNQTLHSRITGIEAAFQTL